MTTTSTTAQEVAETIRQQLGGRRFDLMTGAKNHLYGTSEEGDFLLFSIGRGALKGINKVQITLTPLDVYKVEFFKIGRAPNFKVSTIKEIDGIYAEDLQRLFTDVTGFDTHL